MAAHKPTFSHDAINRHLMEDDVSPNAVRQSVENPTRRSGNSRSIFDDTVLDKRHACKMEWVRSQYSGNEHGIVNCMYVNLDTNEHWMVDRRVYDRERDGKPKLDHVKDMLDEAIAVKTCLSIPF